MDAELKVLEKLFQQCQQDNGPKRIRYMNFINLTYDLETSEDENIALVKKLEENNYVKLKLSVVGDLKSAELTRKGLTYFVEQLDVYPQIQEKIIKTLLEAETSLTNNNIYEKTGIDFCTINSFLWKWQYNPETDTGYLNYSETMNNYQIFDILIEPSKVEELEKLLK